MNKKILIVDDEKNIVDIIAFNLHKEGYDVICAFDGEKGLEAAIQHDPSLILLDIMMPKMDGFETCKKIREKSQVPIILLTARAEEVDKVLGLELGADDYIVKPFSVRELMARIKANLRRSVISPADDNRMLTVGDLSINLSKYEIKKHGEAINLTHREFELVKFLATQSEQVFTREELMKDVWGYEFTSDTRTVDVTVRRIRAKIEDNPDTPVYLLTKRSVGYYFRG